MVARLQTDRIMRFQSFGFDRSRSVLMARTEFPAIPGRIGPPAFLGTDVLSIDGGAATLSVAATPSSLIGRPWEFFKSETKQIFENIVRLLNKKSVKTEVLRTW